MKYNILVTDDEIDNLQLFRRTLRGNYNVFLANSGFEAIEILKNNKVDMIISDHKMPGMDGVELMKKSVSLAPDAIRILITAYTDSTSLMQAINEAKIHRYIRKPWNPNDLLNLINASFEVYQLNIDNQSLALDLKELFSGTISAITEALDAKDHYTFGRSKRVTYYSLKIGEAMELSDQELSELELAGLLHDIGMIGVPESILSKPGNLEPQEYDEIKKHVVTGVKILEDIKQLRSVIRIVSLHHERYDGRGYPYGLVGDEIPVEAQIIAVADAYDGMTSDRAYRKGLPHDFAVEEIKKGSSAQFNPAVVESFLQIIDSAKDEIKNFEAFTRSENTSEEESVLN
jgi:putative nucleotidyltransferase with HDIG domain